MALAPEEAIVEWVNSFEKLPFPVNSARDLEDGRVLLHMLRQADQDYFDSLILTNDKSNPILRSNNLKKLWHQMLDYFSAIRVTLDSVPTFDPKLIVNEHDARELQKLLELALGVFVKCETAQEHLQRIMKLSTGTQHALMALIQSFLAKAASEEESSVFLGSEDQSVKEFAAREQELRTRIAKLDAALSEAKQEKAHLTQLYDSIRKQADIATRERDELKALNDKARKDVEGLQEKLRVAQEDDKKKLAHSLQLQEYAEEVERLKAEKAGLVTKMEEDRREAARKNRALQDENDTLRDQIANQQQERGRLEKLSKKLVDYQELQNQNKALKAQVEQQLQEIALLQSEAEKVKPLSNRVQQYKLEVVEKDMKVTQLEASIAAKDEKITKLTEQFQQKNRDYESLLEKHKQLQQEGANQQDTESFSTPSGGPRKAPSNHHLAADTSDDNLSSFTEVLTPEIKAKLVRLEKENEELRHASEALSRLEDVELLNKKYQEEIVQLNKRIEMREEEAPLPQAQPPKELLEENQSLSAKLKAAQDQIQALTVEKTKLKDVVVKTKQLLDKMKSGTSAGGKENQQVASVSQAHANELAALQNQLLERDKQIELMQKRHLEAREAADKEVSLVKSAFFGVAMDMQRLKALSSAAAPSTGEEGNQGPTPGGPPTKVLGSSSTYLGSLRGRVALIK